MKKMMKWLIVASIMLGGISVSAQTLKIGHIETEKLISQMPEMVSATQVLETKKAEIEEQSMSLREQYRTKMEEYSQNANTYSDIIRTAKEQELQELIQRIQRFEEIAGNEFTRSRDELLIPIYEKATEAIKQVGKENGFTYILDMNGVGILFHSESAHDVLPLVMKKLGINN